MLDRSLLLLTILTLSAATSFAQSNSESAFDTRDPKNAVAGLDVADGLEATLFASEASGLFSPADIDVDHLGRVWVCEVVNYRSRNGERKAGDRILVVEDTDGDGVADKQTVFFQGHEVDSALGIMVLPTIEGNGTRVFVSCAPNVWVFTDDDGDLKSDRREQLFTNVGRPQHDHSTHAFVFGPDGKLYWNFGNTGERIYTKDGKPVVDINGIPVNDSGKPFRQGMAFRCNLDGSEFEVLGHNFRNNYELAVDSFGTVWQSDNDDDGNQGVRINYLMEGGNFGYVDEVTGAGWRVPRTNMEAEVPLQHWHLNDPGVVPNLIQTGGGSPTGICIYEGFLLPEVFRNQIIHCDAGPNVVRSYPAKKQGAGYTANIQNVVNGTRDNWFRPSDVCVAPDGSLIIADWYDPGVGGHRMGDVDRGRLFRIAPPKSRYSIPKTDVSTLTGAIEALKSPNHAARYLAWTALNSKLESHPDETWTALRSMFDTETNPRFRARVLGIAAKSAATRKSSIAAAIMDKDPDIRIAALRLARQKLPSETVEQNVEDVLRILGKLVGDSAIEVRRECALCLRHYHNPRKAELWGRLAVQHDGRDRWYLEALGIGAGNDWDACLLAALKVAGSPSDAELVGSAIARDIYWRSRGTTTSNRLAMIVASGEVTAEEAPRYLRAFDFQTSSQKESALKRLAFGTFGGPAKTQFVNVEALGRLSGFDITTDTVHRADMNRILDGIPKDAQFVTLVEKFNVIDRFPELLKIALANPDQQVGIDAVRALLRKKQFDLLKKPLASKEETTAIAAATVLSNSGESVVAELLLPIVLDSSLPLALRREAVKGASTTRAAVAELIKLADSNSLHESLIPSLSAALHTSSFEEGRLAATKHFPLPPGKDSKPLPSMAELAKMKGRTDHGKTLFVTTGKCNTCHVVNGEGKEVGPNLSEIGTKLSKQALFESIVFPSAGISHNYESWLIVLKNGTTQTGLIVSDDAKGVSIKGTDAIVRQFPSSEIDEKLKQTISLMPADLAKTLSVEEMADLVEYLTTLKKAKK